MKTKWIVIFIFLIFLNVGCYSPITVKVIDAETGAPIEGAVVLVEWTKSVGMIGLSHTESYKVEELLTDKEGKARISGVNEVYKASPDLGSFVVYKKGYVAWSYDYIFPDYKKRTDYKWDSGVIKLERFKPEYSYVKHTSFIHSAIGLGHGDKKVITEAYYWEEKEASKERDNRSRKQ